MFRPISPAASPPRSVPVYSLAIVSVLVALLLPSAVSAAKLLVNVLKACPDCRLPAAPACTSVKEHWDRAATWTPEETVRIHAVSIPEQAEIALYTDIEVSTAPRPRLRGSRRTVRSVP